MNANASKKRPGRGEVCSRIYTILSYYDIIASAGMSRLPGSSDGEGNGVFKVISSQSIYVWEKYNAGSIICAVNPLRDGSGRDNARMLAQPDTDIPLTTGR